MSAKEWYFPLHDRCGCVAQRFTYVLGFEIRVCFHYFFRIQAVGHQSHNGRDGYPESPDAENPTHFFLVNGYAREFHVVQLSRRVEICGACTAILPPSFSGVILRFYGGSLAVFHRHVEGFARDKGSQARDGCRGSRPR